MIPRVIHYCWFGRNPKPLLLQRCINSWKQKCPDYQIVEWNEDNFDIRCNAYVKEAYDAKKWAFITDYARLWIVYNYGGIYLDTDVELLKPLDDLLDAPAYFALEDEKNIATGLGFGAEKGNSVVGCMLNSYDKLHFKNEDGSYDKLPCPIRNTDAVRHLFKDGINSDVVNRFDAAVVYPPEYFCPLTADGTTMKKTHNTYSIHWYSATWLSEDEQIIHKYRIFRGKCEKRFGKKWGSFLARGVYLFFPRRRKILQKYS